MIKHINDNLEISPEILEQIKKLTNFDLLMLLSEIDQHGWEIAQTTLQMILESYV